MSAWLPANKKFLGDLSPSFLKDATPLPHRLEKNYIGFRLRWRFRSRICCFGLVLFASNSSYDVVPVYGSVWVRWAENTTSENKANSKNGQKSQKKFLCTNYFRNSSCKVRKTWRNEINKKKQKETYYFNF